ncbi:MAG: hypothetical protein K2M46_02745 [Lachnospiraceae bacterium]|nr:hypothetical protein [Lachnospiraceae bacterium]
MKCVIMAFGSYLLPAIERKEMCNYVYGFDVYCDAALMERGIPKENIRHYGIVFQGKTVLIG